MKRLLALLLLFATPALAQQQPTKAVDRISIAYGQCVGILEQRADEVTDLKKQLVDAQTKIKELENKRSQN